MMEQAQTIGNIRVLKLCENLDSKTGKLNKVLASTPQYDPKCKDEKKLLQSMGAKAIGDAVSAVETAKSHLQVGVSALGITECKETSEAKSKSEKELLEGEAMLATIAILTVLNGKKHNSQKEGDRPEAIESLQRTWAVIEDDDRPLRVPDHLKARILKAVEGADEDEDEGAAASTASSPAPPARSPSATPSPAPPAKRVKAPAPPGAKGGRPVSKASGPTKKAKIPKVVQID